MREKRIAVVGGGIAGLGAAWLLARQHRVTLFEAEERLGGHSHTVDCDVSDGRVAVDTGFIVYNERNYPHLTGLFDELGVATQPSDMSFSFSAADLDLEYAGDGLATLFAQRRNLVRPAFWRMAGDILRFNRAAEQALAAGEPAAGVTLGGFLEGLGLGEAFRRYYLLPMSAAIWSCPPDEMLAFPARSLLRFFQNHGLIQLSGRPLWRTVTGGSRAVHRADVRRPG
ncbi:MAG: FAD-dependent oxidoreductase [Arhodomonas sp.]|nr:FAD-dependent oxidoreductase [Arhodomonas sp.]